MGNLLGWLTLDVWMLKYVVRKGTNGVSTKGVAASFVFFDRGTFWVLRLTYFQFPQSGTLGRLSRPFRGALPTGVWTKSFLLHERLPCKTAAESALQPLILCSSNYISQGSSSLEECFFTDTGTVSFQISCLFLRPRLWQFEIRGSTDT